MALQTAPHAWTGTPEDCNKLRRLPKALHGHSLSCQVSRLGAARVGAPGTRAPLMARLQRATTTSVPPPPTTACAPARARAWRPKSMLRAPSGEGSTAAWLKLPLLLPLLLLSRLNTYTVALPYRLARPDVACRARAQRCQPCGLTPMTLPCNAGWRAPRPGCCLGSPRVKAERHCLVRGYDQGRQTLSGMPKKQACLGLGWGIHSFIDSPI